MKAVVRTLALAWLLALPACKKAPPAGEGAPGASASGAAPALPPLVVKDDTPNALFTWVDDQGDFHVVEQAKDVPEAGRKAVRIVVAGVSSGTGESVYVADLEHRNPDGSFVVSAMSRSSWDELGASKRKSRLEALAPSAAPPPSTSAETEPPRAPSGQVTATIYGASWCGPCHQAEALLKSLGVKVTMKDIEKSGAAAKEMQDKLRRINRQGGSIPVIDVMGQIFVGFSDGSLRKAVMKARGSTL
jgi:glutaredoxin